MPIRDNQQYRDLEAQLHLYKGLRYLRPIYRLLGENGKAAIEALDRMPEMERQLEAIRSTADDFNTQFLPRGWVAHEYLSQTIADEAIALAKSGNIEAGERLLVDSITRDSVALALQRVSRLDEFRQRQKLLTLALDDHCAGRYHASVMPVIAQIEGIVYDLTGLPFYVNANGGAKHLVISNSIVGHIEGIAVLAAKLSETRPMTTTAQLDRPHRHGIMHGRDIEYANQLTSAKSFGLLLALCSFAELFDQERLRQLALVEPQPDPPPTLLGALRKLRATNDPRTYFLAFPEPMQAQARKYRRPIDANQVLTTIPLLSARRLARELQALGFKCPAPSRLYGGLSWAMSWESVGGSYRVELIGSSAEEVWSVTVTFFGTPTYATNAHGIDFFNFIASVPYQGGETIGTQAWVRDHFTDDGAETVIGGARFRISHHPPYTNLRLLALSRE